MGRWQVRKLGATAVDRGSRTIAAGTESTNKKYLFKRSSAGRIVALFFGILAGLVGVLVFSPVRLWASTSIKSEIRLNTPMAQIGYVYGLRPMLALVGEIEIAETDLPRNFLNGRVYRNSLRELAGYQYLLHSIVGENLVGAGRDLGWSFVSDLGQQLRTLGEREVAALQKQNPGQEPRFERIVKILKVETLQIESLQQQQSQQVETLASQMRSVKRLKISSAQMQDLKELIQSRLWSLSTHLSPEEKNSDEFRKGFTQGLKRATEILQALGSLGDSIAPAHALSAQIGILSMNAWVKRFRETLESQGTQPVAQHLAHALKEFELQFETRGRFYHARYDVFALGSSFLFSEILAISYQQQKFEGMATLQEQSRFIASVYKNLNFSEALQWREDPYASNDLTKLCRQIVAE